MSIKLVVGLGNPGRDHIYDRHNLGFMLIDYVAHQQKFKLFNHRDFAIGRKKFCGREINFLKPLTFMNLSGLAVKQYATKKKILPQEILVVVDDFNLNKGVFRLRQRGSSGGHKGLESISEWLKTEYFSRLRVGIGPVPDGVDAKNFVLQKFTREELPMVARIKQEFVSILKSIIKDGVENLTIDICEK